MDIKILNQTAVQMVANSKGILAIDESHGTIQKRFDSLGIEVNEENRRSYRDMLLTTNSLSNYISGAILFDETIRQKTSQGKSFPDYLNEIGIIPGIKVDTGAKPFSCHENEKITEGLDNLPQRMEEYGALGAKFAKWRAVITIGKDIPSNACMIANAQALARYASICQDVNIVPIVEPEVLMDGPHDINKCFEVTNIAQSILFEALDKLNVDFSGVILKPNMVTSGSTCKIQASTEEISELTVKCLGNNVPKKVPGITFLSGGQSDSSASNNLSNINKINTNPWKVTFSYGRALQLEAMKKWGGDNKNSAEAQKIIGNRAYLNSLAASGKYNLEMENN
ncbi:fructose-bisphosphate aldolase class I [Gammaproteobacteria bacterium]|nr:fructose-bisphosphate aldolase class I [Gammaproteobacteria bacterium]